MFNFKKASRMQKFAVVEFIGTKSVAAIPTKWFTSDEEDSCYWPAGSSKNVSKLVAAAGEADTTWGTHSIRVLGKAATYIRAREKLKMSEETSDLQTDVEDEPKRKRRRNNRLLSDSESDASSEEDNTVEISIPTPPAMPQASNRPENGQTAVTQSVTPRRGSILRTPQPIPLVQQPQTSSSRAQSPSLSAGCSSLEAERQTPARINSSSPSPSLQSVSSDGSDSFQINFMNKVLAILEEVKETQRLHGSLLNSLMRKGAVVREESSLSDATSFPVNTLAELESVEQKLIDPDYEKALVVYLSDLGADKLLDSTKRMMQFLISNDLCFHLNFTGRHNKTAFGTSRLFSAICKSMKHNAPTSTCNRQDIERAVAKWLGGARDRNGNRARRAEAAKTKRAEGIPVPEIEEDDE